MSKRLTLVLGGVRAGKSTYAQQLADQGEKVLFVATAEALDEDMTNRIRAHQEARPADWDTLEEPLDIVGALGPILHRYDTVLLDCLTLWVSNLLLKGEEIGADEVEFPSEVRRLLELYESGSASWVVVSNEVGLGVIASTRLGRVYAEELGRVNQIVAAAADDVLLMAAGLPLSLKTSTGPA